MSFVSENFPAAKAGDAIRIFAVAKEAFDAGLLPVSDHYAFAWILYYALHQSPKYDIMERKRMLALYFKLDIKKPHKLHSMILLEAMRLRRDAIDRKYNDKEGDAPDFSIVRFSEIWNLENLRPGDWKRKPFQDKEMASTVDKFITLYVNELESTSTPPSDSFRAVITKALEEYGPSANLLGQMASVLALDGKNKEAREMLRKAVISAPRKFYLWAKLASMVDRVEEPRLYVGLLAHALAIRGQDEFKGKIRLDLARFFIEKEKSAEALWELQIYKRLYEEKGWGLSKSFLEAMNAIPAGTVAANPSGIYRYLIQRAEEEVFSCLEEIEMTKTYHRPAEADKNPRFDKPSVAWRLTDVEGQNYWIIPRRFRLVEDLPLGTPIMVRLFQGHPVTARPK